MSDITPTFCGLTAEEILQMKQRNTELAAQVELLQSFLMQVKCREPEIAIPSFLMKTGKCLAEHDREVAASAVEPAIRSALRTFGNADLSEDEIKKLAFEYSRKVLRGEI